MKIPDALGMTVPQVTVATSDHGGHPPDFWAAEIVKRLIFVAENAPMPIREQALAYKDQMMTIVLDGIRQALASDRAYRRD